MPKSRLLPRYLWTGLALVLLLAFFLVFQTVSDARAARSAGTGGWIPAAAGLVPNSPDAQAISSSTEQITLSFSFAGVQAEPAKLAGQTYTRLSGQDLGSNAIPGQPELPYLSRDVQIPFKASYTLEITGSEYTEVKLADFGLPERVYPAQISQSKSGPVPPVTAADATAYATNAFLPARPVETGTDYIQRGRRGLSILLQPVQYNPVTGSLRIYSRIDVTLHLKGGDAALTRQMAERYASPDFEALQSATLLNYGLPGAEAARLLDTPPGYLIITANSYAAGLAPFVTLKQAQGFTVTLATLSQTGTTTTDIKNYIQTFYNANPSLAYLLLVGDLADGSDTLPAYNGLEGSHLTDLYYATLAGGDSVPDIGYGRFPVRDTTQLANMVNKALAYESLDGTEVWIKKAAFLATSDTCCEDIAEGTHNYVISTYTSPLGYTGSFPANPQAGGDKLYAITYSATTANVLSALNDGRSMVVYSGHGNDTSWSGPALSQGNVSSLTSTDVYAYAAGHACMTGRWNTTESFAETWVIQPNKGALVYFGASDYTYWDEDDVLERKIFNSLFSGSKPSVATMTQFGLNAVASQFSMGLYYREEYHIFGDPSVKLILEPRNSDFTLSADPTAVNICSAGQTTSTLNLGSLVGFSNPVTLSVSGAPAGVTSEFSINPVTPPASSLLTLTADGTSSPGVYPLSIQGSAEPLQHSTTLNLTLTNSAPIAPTLLTPANGASSQPLQPVFTWSAVPQAVSYTIQIASDSGFTTIIDTATTSEPTYTALSELPSNTRLYWRVTANNACGQNQASYFSFTTLALPGDCPLDTTVQTLLSNGFEDDTSGWTTSSGNSYTWAIQQATVHTGLKAFMAPDPDVVSDLRLISPQVTLPASGLDQITLQYFNWREMEASSAGCYDGGILEVSTNSGSTWTQITGTDLVTDPYTGVIENSFTNPLTNLSAWCGTSNGWLHSVVNLQAYAGQTVQLRFRLGSDSSVGKTGWSVDDVKIQGCSQTTLYGLYLPTVLQTP